MGLGRLQPGMQVFQESGEAAVQQKLPKKFISNTPATSPISDHLTPPRAPTGYAGSTPHLLASGVVRQERTIGMRYLYAIGHQTQPVLRLGADGPPYPWDSSFNEQDAGPIRNGGFNDALFQAGYPGINLGLSFKVPVINAPSGYRPTGVQGGPVPTRGQMKLHNITQKLTRVRRANRGPEQG
jgi:hypothetical protein